jgi:hypothetical protein
MPGRPQAGLEGKIGMSGGGRRPGLRERSGCQGAAAGRPYRGMWEMWIVEKHGKPIICNIL